MILTEEQRREFEEVTRPVIEWLDANCHPHAVVVVEPDRATLSESVYTYPMLDFLRD